MLNAIFNGKKRGTGLEGIALKLGEAEGAEDVLTATVFERLSYLPDAVLTEFLSHLLLLDLPPLDEIEFWPWWTLDGSCVEPDVLLTCGTRRVLVEAKRHDFSQQQYAEQLARELLAGWREDVLGESVTLLTVGGLDEYSPTRTRELKNQIFAAVSNATSTAVPEFELICRSWRDVYRSLDQVVGNAQGYGKGLQRIVDDIESAFSWHGLRTHPPLWLGSLRGQSLDNDMFPCFNTFRRSTVHVHSTMRPLVALAPAYIKAAADSFDILKFSR
ncbi:hypothetical protein [Caballeronia sp. INSB1]|uniref:hypothetical protein n=1 Tax=Caballeronia sp. INSB1 TaxID=2921751 RepID=UPI00203263DD|nr:hypothetical protein [Caballeronia sp. INSB1]